MVTAVSARRVSALRRLVSGQVTTPGESGYAEATATWDLSVRSAPPLALAAATSADIAVAARGAADEGMGISMRNTGHGAFSTDHDALVISTARLHRVELDTASAVVRVQPGARWTDVDAVATPKGLCAASGGSAGVGVVGYTLGGGLGPLGRTLGFAADRVRSLTVLNEHYRPVRVSDEEEPELFWALRGGGPLGIVTALEFDVSPIASFFGGGIYFDGASAPALLAAYAAWVDTLDERTTTSLALIHLPPAPQLPPSLRGRFVVHLRIAHVDPAASDLLTDGHRLLAPMLAAASPLENMTDVMTPADLPAIHRDPVTPQDVAYRGGFVDALDRPAIEAICASMAVGQQSAAPRMVELRHLGGAYDRSPIAPSSTTGRHHLFNLYITATADPADALTARALVDTTAQRISSTAAGQFNFYGPAPAPGEILKLWNPPQAQRLIAASTRLDPDRRLRTGRPLQ